MDSPFALQPSSHSTTNTQYRTYTTIQDMEMERTPSPGSLDGDGDFEDAPSSPMMIRSPERRNNEFMNKLKLDIEASANHHGNNAENVSPHRHKMSPSSSSVTSDSNSIATSIEKGPVSPLKPLRSRTARSPPRNPSDPAVKAAHRQSVNRFPVKISVSRPISPHIIEETVSLDQALRNNEGLDKAIRILEDGDSVMDYGHRSSQYRDDVMVDINEDAEHEDFADETAFSSFSAVPDMTTFAKFGHSPSKFSVSQNSRQSPNATPSMSRRHSTFSDHESSPTPRKAASAGSNGHEIGSTTNLIVDFTEQFQSFSGSRISPSKTAPDLLAFTHNARTPSPNKHRQTNSNNRMSHLLDFDIPPAPTPRSMPSITPRELESLKSGFLSEISSLKSSLMGREAEVQFLKTAVGDAEKRVGECMEQLREQSTFREQLEIEKEGWENRGQEMEDVLRNVREEIVHVERQRESVEGRLQESEMRREAAESMAQEAESKMAGMRASSAVLNSSEDKKSTSSSREVEIAVEKVARELHTLYKGKHETKVAALKRSYESKWDKKVRELEQALESLGRENEDLKNGHDATMSRVMSMADKNKADQQQQAADAKHTRELEARLEGLHEEIRSIKLDNEVIRAELERERVEKGELVVACDELLALQMAEPAPTPASPPPLVVAPASAQHGSPRRPVSSIGLARPPSAGTNDTFRTSITVKSRPMSMIRAPGAYSSTSGTPLASRIGKMGTSYRKAE